MSRARHSLDEGVSGYVHWLGTTTRLLLADTSIRSLQLRWLKAPVRTYDLCGLISEISHLTPELCVLDVASQETFGRCLAEARESPFQRIEELRRAAPGLVLRATISSATSLGSTVAPRSALGRTTEELVRAGVDIIRITDPFNDLDRLVAAITASLRAGAVVEGALCLDGSLRPGLPGSSSAAVAVASGLERHGAHVITIEDRNGALRPVGAYSLVRDIRREVSLPVWVRVVESGAFGLATLLSAAEAGAAGADTIVPSLAGPGLEPDSVALANALHDTERRPEPDLLSLTAVDDHVKALAGRLGGWRRLPRPPADALDRGASPASLAELSERLDPARLVSSDQALAACEAAWRALGQPAAVSPAQDAIVELASQMIDTGEAAGPLLDRARADDPQGLLDSVGSLRDGGFPEGTIAEIDPDGRRPLLKLLWGEVADRFFEHQDRYGEIEMLPGEVALHGLGPGESVELTIDGSPRQVKVISIDNKGERAVIEVDGERHEIAVGEV